MINYNGYHPNIGVVAHNTNRQVLWVKRTNQDVWQFPHGGIQTSETPKIAMYRTLFETVGLNQQDVRIISESHHWVKYNLPIDLIHLKKEKICMEQKQKWYLVRLLCNDGAINIKNSHSPEYDDWQWVNYWYPIRYVIPFKKVLYRRIMEEFSKKLFIL
ncbi:RNA pyrophosphohydrolase [Candidatus Erwinia haradaeae]|uniref:RNA pyrophosphohydrolase n=1 Tax=Candidatus Erwinia haradaeae TaxID=1922217 RepID=A0A451DDN1_9GAMM|nr:RNA pyrophosphohydrolase [Candidatus Erwinia haradaeae]VFP84595.1 RNA pyrophosphohydrolase [Candidatus Erwinia haradaeae]